MHDGRPFLCVLTLTAVMAAAVAAGWAFAGETVRDAVFAALKMVVIR